MGFYNIPNVFFQRYLFLLSPEAFTTLIRFYKFYLDSEEKYKDKKEEFEVPFSIFKSQIVVSDDNNIVESVWGELTYWDLAKRYYKNNVYVLNLNKIYADNGSKNDICDFSIKIFDKKGKIRRKKNIKIYMDKYIDGILSRCSKNTVAEKLRKTIEGVIEYFNKKNKKIELEDIRKLTDPLLDADERTMGKVCDIYNNDKNLYTNRHPNYIVGILKNIQDEKIAATKSKNSSDFKSKSLDKYAIAKDESNKTLALKIARGQIEGNIAYNSYLELGDIRGLKKLYNDGVNILKDERNDDKIFKEYEWLK